jgi:hypothetical protein
VVWITIVNLLYLLLQVVVGADDCRVRDAVTRVASLLGAQFATVSQIFGATLVLIVLAMAASILGAYALFLITFVPLVGLAALPLQLIAWVVRGLVFEFIGLTALTAYARLQRVTREGHTANLHQIGRTA